MVDEARAAGSLWEWYPNEGVGPVHFGDSLQQHVFSLRLKRTEMVIDPDGDERAWYDTPGGEISFHVVNGTIISASCGSLIYKGGDLVGLSEPEVILLFGRTATRWGEYPADTSMFVDDLNCILTFDHRGGHVAAVAVNGGGRRTP